MLDKTRPNNRKQIQKSDQLLTFWKGYSWQNCQNTGDFGLTFNVPKPYGKIKHSNAPY